MLKVPEQRIQQLLTQMTLDEKLAQLASFWSHELQECNSFSHDKATCLLSTGIGQITRPASDSAFEPAAVASFDNAVQSFLVNETRLAIPAIIHDECCAGYMGLGGTAFPQMLGLASTFEPQLAEHMTVEIRKQLRSVGIHQGLAPVLDVARDPRWGRVEETFGEDPLLVSHFGMAYVSGLQGENLADGGVMATGKHFVGHGFSQGGQNCAPVRLGIHDLWNVYLVPFQAAIQVSKLHTIMNAYPELDGDVVASSRRILTDLLRNKLGFRGLVVADYEAIKMIHTYQRVAENKRSAAVLALTAGIDMELPSKDCYGDPLRAALDSNEITLEFVDTAVERILRKKIELGLFENPFVDEGRVPEFFETTGQRSLALEIARKSMVLLKNNSVLPFSKDIHTLAVIGPNAESKRNLLGDYSYPAVFDLKSGWMPGGGSNFEKPDVAHIERHSIQVPTIVSALKTALPATVILYAKGCDNLENNTSGFEEALTIARQADAVILVLGDRSGLTPDCTVGETRDSADLKLPGVQELLFENILTSGKPVIVVLVTGRPYAISRLAEKADAILEAWLPGEEGAAAIVETLLGLNNPGGKLAITYPRHVGQVPIYYNQKPSGGKSNWYTNYVNVEASPLFPFGYGLSYTTFKYSHFSISHPKGKSGEVIDISVNITNTGNVTGDEVVQLYIQDEYGCVPRPIKELKGYKRLTLHPGETKIVVFQLPINQLAFYDLQLNYIVESGTFKLMIGSSSDDIRCEGKFIVEGDRNSPVNEPVYICPIQIL